MNHSVAAADDAEAMRIGGAHLARLIGFGVGVSSAEANQNPLFLTAANIQREKVVVPHRGQLLGMDDGGHQHGGGGALERARGSLHGARDAGAGEAGAGTSGAGTSGGVVVLGGTRAALGAASEPTGKAQVTAHAATAEERREGELHAPLRLEGRPELEPMAVDGTPHTIQQIHECHHVRRQVHQEHAQEPRHQASTGPDTAGPPLELAGSERVVVDADVGHRLRGDLQRILHEAHEDLVQLRDHDRLDCLEIGTPIRSIISAAVTQLGGKAWREGIFSGCDPATSTGVTKGP